MNLFNWILGKKDWKENDESSYLCLCGSMITTGLPSSPTWKKMLRDFKKMHGKCTENS